MKNMILVGLMSIALFTGCSAIKSPIDSGYEFGDMTKSVIKVQAKYCSETDPVKRAIMLTAIKGVFPDFPTSGACTELQTLIGEDNVKDIAENVDFEQAIEDQKKFQSK